MHHVSAFRIAPTPWAGVRKCWIFATVTNGPNVSSTTAGVGYQTIPHSFRNGSEFKARIIDASYLARSETDVPVSPSELDTNAWLLNCENRTVDLRTGELLRHQLADLLTKMASVD
jgi:hypothetical protein